MDNMPGYTAAELGHPLTIYQVDLDAGLSDVWELAQQSIQ